MRSSPFPAAVLACLLALLGCATTSQRQITQLPNVHAKLVAVYPFSFRWPEPAYRSFELSERLLQTGIKATRNGVAFLGPSEFRVYRAQDDRAWAASDLVAQLPSLDTKPEDVFVLRPWAERTVESSSQEATNAGGKAVRASNNEGVTFQVHVEILHPSTGTRVAELSGTTKVDPFAAGREDDSDPAPELTALMTRLTEDALNAVQNMLDVNPSPRVLTLSFLFNPDAALDFSDNGRPPLRVELEKGDALSGEVLRQNRVRFANPGITEAELARLSRLPGGMVVQKSSGRFEAFDTITQVNAKPALPETLGRARLSHGPVSVRVKKANGDWGEFVLF